MKKYMLIFMSELNTDFPAKFASLSVKYIFFAFKFDDLYGVNLLF